MPKFAGDVKLSNRIESSVCFFLLCNGETHRVKSPYSLESILEIEMLID